MSWVVYFPSKTMGSKTKDQLNLQVSLVHDTFDKSPLFGSWSIYILFLVMVCMSFMNKMTLMKDKQNITNTSSI